MPHPSRPSPRAIELLALLGLVALALAWLVPNKLAPWVSLANEGVAALGLLLLAPLALRQGARAAWAWPLAALVLAALASAWGQRAAGVLAYAGDAWLVTLYLGLFALALAAGRELASGAEARRWLNALALALVAAGVASSALVLAQWLWANPPTILVQEVPPGQRPYANLGQRNHANSLFFVALCALLQLRRERSVGRAGTLLAALLLVLAMALTQSRTGLVQWALLAAWGAWLALGARERGAWRWGALALGVGGALWLAMPWITEALLLPTPARDLALEQQTTGGLRWRVWRDFFDAALQQPWTGYGWLQSGAAQLRFAACDPGVGAFFSYTHLLALDWALWLGLPLALALCALAAYWLWPHLGARAAAAGGYWTAAVLGLGVHALLEYPQAYLYFLLPLGLMMGVIDARHPVQRALALGRRGFAVLWLALAALAALVLWDAARASAAYTEIRFENARIGARRQAPQIPQPLLLDNLQGFLQLSAADLTRAPDAHGLADARTAALRYPHLNSLLREAWLLAASGDAAASARTQQLVCDIYGARGRKLAVRQWRDWQHGAPALGVADFRGQVLAPRCAPGAQGAAR